jgi:hypothetical protein
MHLAAARSLAGRARLRLLDADPQISDDAVKGGHLRIIRLWNVDPGRFMAGDHEVQQVHRIEVDLLAQIR